MPYFDRTYFDSSYFDTDAAAANVVPPLGGHRYLQQPDEPDEPAPIDLHEDEDLFFL